MNWLVCLATAFLGSVGIVLLLRRKKENRRECERDYPKNTVILHQFPRGPFAPSMSAFCIKLETFLRMAQIPYQNVFAFKKGPKDKVPWIEYNELTISDSQLIMTFLSEELKVDFNKTLSPEQKAVARALQKMVDEHTYWLVLLERWVFHRRETAATLSKLPSIAIWYIGRRTKQMAYEQGLGRHEPLVVEKMLEEDLVALSDFLGDKKFMFGDEPTEVDCAIFGQVAQVKWHVPTSIKGRKLLEESLTNLNSYCDRMKDKFWPDWQECINQGFTKKATK